MNYPATAPAHHVDQYGQPIMAQPIMHQPNMHYPHMQQPHMQQQSYAIAQPAGWITMPQFPVLIPDCPPGLEYLAAVNSMFVRQKVELLEAITGFETANKYTIKDAAGQKIFWAAEDSDCCTRNCCGPTRPFDMQIMDAYQNEVIHINRPLRCQSCWFPCCLQTMEVSSPPGTVIGTIEQNWSILKPNFSLKNRNGETILKIIGPVCTFSCCGNDVVFKMYNTNDVEVGRISKEWSGFVKEAFTDADNFGIQFPEDLDVRMKAVCLGACFLIDMMFFEKSGNQENDRPGML